MVIATVIQIATEAMFQHHYYGFAGKKFQQKEGGPIGLRGTCTIARLAMQVFDKKWGKLVEKAGLKIDLYARYMDDGRICMYPLKRGWRWDGEDLVYCKRWELEDSKESLLSITVRALQESMKDVASYLNFTYETGMDFEDGWLPTLDTNLKVDSNNQVLYKYYEKPTTTNTTIRMTTAMAENPKMQCLSNDLVRRLLNTQEDLPSRFRAEVVDSYGVKLLTSGYSLDQTRKILVNGMKGYAAKVTRRKMVRRRIHLTASESAHGRRKKRLLGASSWYKDKQRLQMDSSTTTRSNGGEVTYSSPLDSGKNMVTRAVLFVEQSPMGELAKQLKEQIRRLEPILGYKLRVVERTGKNILSSFPQASSWKGMKCGREECVTCNQGGEDVPDCTKASIVYESICVKCNPSATSKGELREVKEGAPSLYVGESSRSIQERAIEHWGAARRGDTDGHMCKHQSLEHPGEPPEFLFKIVSTHRTALNRQIREAVRIRRRGGAGMILNSKAEFNRREIRVIPCQTTEKKLDFPKMASNFLYHLHTPK